MVLLKKLSTRRRDAMLCLVIHLKSVFTLSTLKRLRMLRLTGSNVLQRFACSPKRLSIYEAHACVSTFQNRIIESIDVD